MIEHQLNVSIGPDRDGTGHAWAISERDADDTDPRRSPFAARLWGEWRIVGEGVEDSYADALNASIRCLRAHQKRCAKRTFDQVLNAIRERDENESTSSSE
jgi:hypothetical protein